MIGYCLRLLSPAGPQIRIAGQEVMGKVILKSTSEKVESETEKEANMNHGH